ncbi:MAG: choice-of-anchor J domain-containing protein, partial [Weeksellaceae bacterium]
MKKFIYYFLLFSLPSLAFGQILKEDFDDITTLSANGWIMTNQSNPTGTTGWFQGNSNTFPSQQGANNSYIAANFNNTSGMGHISNWLITPTVFVKDGDIVSFWTRTTENTVWNDHLEVRSSQGATILPSGANSVGSFTNLLLEINGDYDMTYPKFWDAYYITISGVGSIPVSMRFAFRYNVENGGPAGIDSNYIGIDSVLIFSGGVYNISTASNPISGGSTTGGGNYAGGSTATVKANPSLGNTFINWTENGTPVSTNAEYSFTVTSNRNLVANFSLNAYTIATSSNPTEGGTTTGAGNY